MTDQLRICLLEPWYGGSHRRWVDGLVAVSTHQMDLFTLPARHWKWRMHGAAVTLASQVIESGNCYDLVIANDMMDVAVFKSLINSAGLDVPITCYFHENQLSYPVSPRDTDISSTTHQRWLRIKSFSIPNTTWIISSAHFPGFWQVSRTSRTGRVLEIFQAKPKCFIWA